MGLFNSSKIPQKPLPDLAIHLYFPTDKVFQPDDVVSGHITLIPIESITPQAIEVSLFGRSLVWHRTSHRNQNETTDYHHWRDNAPLFEVTQNVLPGAMTTGISMESSILKAGATYTFPFQFRFPKGTGNSRVGQYEKNTDERWTIQPHNLPPTFLHTYRNGKGTEPDYAKIEYGVRARLRCPGVGVVRGRSLTELSGTASVLFQPSNTALQLNMQEPSSMLRQSKAFHFQSSILNGQAANQIGFRQNMRDRFSSKTPKLDFETILEIPQYLTSGTEFRVRASFHVVGTTENVTHLPPIKFIVLKLELLDYTFIRAPRDWEASSMGSGSHGSENYENMPSPDAPFKGQEHRDFSERKITLNCIPESTILELEQALACGDKMQLGQAKSYDAWFTARVPGTTPSSFCSFAITRAYRIKVKVGVEIGGKLFTSEVTGNINHVRSAPM